MVFVDISGFTKLSERLARTGREGAEHLVDTISACFSTLLAEAYANGGSLLKFGGDALLVWFAGVDHAARGCSLGDCDAPHAAADRPDPRGREQHRAADVGRRAQRALRDVPRRRIASRVPDRRPFGGRARGARVGGPGGPDPRQRPDRCAAPRSLPRCALRAGRAARPRARGRGCGCSTTLRRRPPTSRSRTASPPPLRAHLLAAPAHPEHRTATVSFLQFGELDGLIERRGRRRPPRRRSTRSCAPPRRRRTATRSASSARTSPPTAGSCCSAPARRARSATTRSACCSRCATSSTPARGCRCGRASTAATSSPARSARPTAARTR